MCRLYWLHSSFKCVCEWRRRRFRRIKHTDSSESNCLHCFISVSNCDTKFAFISTRSAKMKRRTSSWPRRLTEENSITETSSVTDQWCEHSKAEMISQKKSHLERQDYTMNKLVRKKKTVTWNKHFLRLARRSLWVSSSICCDAKKCFCEWKLTAVSHRAWIYFGNFSLFPWSAIKLWPFFLSPPS